MRYRFPSVSLTAAIVAFFATTISMTMSATLSGTVYDQNNVPRSGVLVSLVGEGIVTTTDSSGIWTLHTATNIVSPLFTVPDVSHIIWNGNAVYCLLKEAGPVRIDMVDTRGARIGNGFYRILGPGYYRIPLQLRHATMIGYFHIQTRHSNAVIPVIEGLKVTGRQRSIRNGGSKWVSATTGPMDSLNYSSAGIVLASDRISLATDTMGIIRFLTIPPYKGIPWNDTIHYGVLNDARDSRIYRTVTIGTQVWMAQNLDFGLQVNGATDQADYGGEKYCYKDVTTRCDTFGGLYQWTSVMGLEAEYSHLSASGKIQTTHRGVCPQGWHVPTSSEWSILKNYVNQRSGNDSMSAQTLKSTSNWATEMGWGPGTDELGFRAIAGGGRYYEGYNESNTGSESYFRWCCRFRGMFWTASQSNDTSAYYEDISDDKTSLTRMSAPKTYGFCVRCVKD